MWPDDFDIDTTLLALEDAKVVLTGKHNGESFVLEGDVGSLSIQQKSKRETWSNRILPPPSEYRLTFKPQYDGVAYTVKTKPVRVERTARTEATDRTVESIEAARVRVGAPKKAKFRYSDIMRMDAELQVKPWDSPRPVEVELLGGPSMSEELEEETPTDAFAPENVPGISLIVQLRIYDALMAILTHLDEDTARDLLELHANGNLVATAPWINGVFIADELNKDNISTAPE